MSSFYRSNFLQTSHANMYIVGLIFCLRMVLTSSKEIGCMNGGTGITVTKIPVWTKCCLRDSPKGHIVF